jgi:hypothetical protein
MQIDAGDLLRQAMSSTITFDARGLFFAVAL